MTAETFETFTLLILAASLGMQIAINADGNGRFFKRMSLLGWGTVLFITFASVMWK